MPSRLLAEEAPPPSQTWRGEESVQGGPKKISLFSYWFHETKYFSQGIYMHKRISLFVRRREKVTKERKRQTETISIPSLLSSPSLQTNMGKGERERGRAVGGGEREEWNRYFLLTRTSSSLSILLAIPSRDRNTYFAKLLLTFNIETRRWPKPLLDLNTHRCF